MPNADIGRDPEAYLREKVALKEVTKADADVILRYITAQTVEKGLKPHSSASLARYLVKAAKKCPGIRQWNYEKVASYVAYCRQNYKPNTSRKDIVCIRALVLWLIEEELVRGIDAGKISKIKPTPADKMTKTAADMLTAEDVTKMIRSTKNSRDRAMIAVLFEGALRPFELLALRWGDIHNDEHGAVLNTAGKTGKPRRIRLILSSEYLNAWRNDYPDTIRQDLPVFVNQDTTSGKNRHQLTRVALRKIVDKAKKTLPGRNVHPYLFRHSRVTEMLAQGVPESVIKMQAWGSISSPMLATYGHLSGEQADTFLLAAAGKERAPKRQVEATLSPRKCPGCGKENLPGIEYCGTCGAPLDIEAYHKKMAEEPAEITQLREENTAIKQQLQAITEMLAKLVPRDDGKSANGPLAG